MSGHLGHPGVRYQIRKKIQNNSYPDGTPHLNVGHGPERFFEPTQAGQLLEIGFGLTDKTIDEPYPDTTSHHIRDPSFRVSAGDDSACWYLFGQTVVVPGVFRRVRQSNQWQLIRLCLPNCLIKGGGLNTQGTADHLRMRRLRGANANVGFTA